MTKKIRVALVGKQPIQLDTLAQYLATLGNQVCEWQQLSGLDQLAGQDTPFQIALVETDLNDAQQCTDLKAYYLAHRHTAIIAICSHYETERAITLVKYGIQDVLDSQTMGQAEVVKAVLFTLERHQYRGKLRTLTESSQKLIGFDQLTGLPNYNLLQSSLRYTLANADRGGQRFAIALMNFVDLKSVNRTMGYEMGDALLKLGTQRIQHTLRKSDQVARIGGDEFVVILNNLQHSEDAALILKKLIDKLSQPYKHAGKQIHLGCSIGVSHYPEDGADADVLMRAASAAAQCAKNNGYWRYEIYNPDISQGANLQINWLNDFNRALANNEFELHYQPQFNTQTNDVVGVEALVRWNHPTQGMIPPDQFIENAEKHNLIVPLGDWVLNQACMQLRQWREAGLRDLHMAINISAKQFAQPNFIEKIKVCLQQYRLLPHYLELELTESTLTIDPARTSESLKILKKLGVQLAIDDFGTGYSSLSYLKKFDVDALKIDRSFVMDLLVSESSASITQAVISLAHALELDVIAEGVEKAGQKDFLESHHCFKMQGFYFARPLPANACTQFLMDNEERHPNRLSSGSDPVSLTVKTDQR